jgi:hypothetical protein
MRFFLHQLTMVLDRYHQNLQHLLLQYGYLLVKIHLLYKLLHHHHRHHVLSLIPSLMNLQRLLKRLAFHMLRPFQL